MITPLIPTDLRDYSNDELLEELVRRHADYVFVADLAERVGLAQDIVAAIRVQHRRLTKKDLAIWKAWAKQ